MQTTKPEPMRMNNQTDEYGHSLGEQMNPGMLASLQSRYGSLLPGMPQNVVNCVYGQIYSRPGLALRDRYIATIAALSAQGGQTAPQLRLNIAAGRKAGLSQTEIAEIIWQMSVYGGVPAAINGLNTALDVFSREQAMTSQTET
jgi:4-carboxymuconolactone decarboxylase